MSCGFPHDDAAYVLGSLVPVERLEFERHLTGCDSCTRAVRELAGLPGLLGRVDATVLEEPAVGGPATVVPPPDTLLPALSREVRRTRRRRTLATSGLAAAAAAVVVSLGLVVLDLAHLDGQPGADGGVPQTPAATATPAAQPMAPVGDVPVRASVTLEPVTWGTRLGLTCSYDPTSVDYDLPPEVDYVLFVRTRDGRTEQVGSWRSVGGTTMRLAAATAATRRDITSVEVRTPDGRVVLTLAA